MLRRILFLTCFLLPMTWAPHLVRAGEPFSFRPAYKSPLGLAVDQKGLLAYVALHTAGAVAVVDLQAGRVLQEISLGPRPGIVHLLNGELQVCCTESSQLIILDPVKRTVVRRSTLSPEELFDRKYSEGAYDLFRPTSAEEIARRPGERYSKAWGSAVSGLADCSVYQWAKDHLPATQVAQGWIFTSVLAEGSSREGPGVVVPLDEPQRGFSVPTHAALAPYGRRLAISCGGADTVLVLDGERFPSYVKRSLPKTAKAGDTVLIPDLSASRHYVLARISTQTNPRRLAYSGDGKTLVVSNYLADSLTVIDAEKLQVLRHIPLGGPPPDAARRGEILFNSGKMTFQGQFTCASCHPHGGSDGLVWDLERDGIGNFKKTKSLLGVKDTGPYGWHGSSPTLADRVRGTLRTLHRHEPTEGEVTDLVAYLESLPPPEPLPVRDADKPAVARGRILFEGKAQCGACHQRGVMLDDGRTHDVGTRGPTDTQDRFDTPGLRGVVRNAPYLHDGRAATLEEVFTKHDGKQRHGAAHALTREEFQDLIAYLKSL